MQVCDLTQYVWMPVSVVQRDVPTLVPLIAYSDGQWCVHPTWLRVTVASVITLPFLRRSE